METRELEEFEELAEFKTSLETRELEEFEELAEFKDTRGDQRA